MLMMRRVPLTLIAAHAARRDAHVERLTQHVGVGPGAPRRQPRRGTAHVSAIKVEANTLPEFGDLVFGQAGIRARAAALHAGQRGINRGDQRRIHVAVHVGVCGNDGVGGHPTADAIRAPPGRPKNR